MLLEGCEHVFVQGLSHDSCCLCSLFVHSVVTLAEFMDAQAVQLKDRRLLELGRSFGGGGGGGSSSSSSRDVSSKDQ